MKDKYKIFRDMLLLCIFNILVCFILKLLGFKDFDIVVVDNSINNNIYLQIACNLVLMILNAFFIVGIIIKQKLKKIQTLIIFITSLLYYILCLFVNIGYYYIIVDIIYFIFVVLIISRDKKKIIETILVIFLLNLYQYISLITKNLSIGISNNGFIESLIFQIDYYMLMIITLIYVRLKGVELYVILWWRIKTIFLFLTKRRSKEKCLQQNEKTNQKVEIGFVIFNSVVAITQIFIVFTFCYFVHNTILNVLFIFLAFVFLRARFGNSYHADKITTCTFVSTLVFYISTRASLPLDISILSTIIIGSITAFVMYLLHFYIKHSAKKKKNSNRDKIIAILGIDNLDEDSIEKVCLSIGKPKLAETIFLYINNTIEETSEILEVDISTITRRVNTFIKLIEQK